MSDPDISDLLVKDRGLRWLANDVSPTYLAVRSFPEALM
jgi:hypothetical protein